jgi:hypothetical protein
LDDFLRRLMVLPPPTASAALIAQCSQFICERL